MHDWQGKYIKPGTKVLYSTRSGSSMTQNIGVVKEVIIAASLYKFGVNEEKAKVHVTSSSSKFEKLPRNVTISNANLTVIGD